MKIAFVILAVLLASGSPSYAQPQSGKAKSFTKEEIRVLERSVEKAEKEKAVAVRERRAAEAKATAAKADFEQAEQSYSTAQALAPKRADRPSDSDEIKLRRLWELRDAKLQAESRMKDANAALEAAKIVYEDAEAELVRADDKLETAMRSQLSDDEMLEALRKKVKDAEPVCTPEIEKAATEVHALFGNSDKLNEEKQEEAATEFKKRISPGCLTYLEESMALAFVDAMGAMIGGLTKGLGQVMQGMVDGIVGVIGAIDASGVAGKQMPPAEASPPGTGNSPAPQPYVPLITPAP